MKTLLLILIILITLVLCGAAALFAVRRLSVELSTPVLIPTVGVIPASTPTNAPPPIQTTVTSASPNGGPFAGEFAGTLVADNATSAPITLALTQSGQTVSGVMSIGEGLVIDGGSCGQQPVPSGEQRASGQVDPNDPNHLAAAANFSVSGVTIAVELDANLSTDGNSLETAAAIRLPFLCGRTPSISGLLTRR